MRVKLFDGRVLIDKFVDGNDRWIILETEGKVMKRDIDSFGIYKPHEVTP